MLVAFAARGVFVALVVITFVVQGFGDAASERTAKAPPRVGETIAEVTLRLGEPRIDALPDAPWEAVYVWWQEVGGAYTRYEVTISGGKVANVSVSSR